MTYEELKTWWYDVCPRQAKSCRVNAFNWRDGSDKYTVVVEYDGYEISIEGRTVDETHQKALRMIGDKPEFQARKKPADIVQIADSATTQQRSITQRLGLLR